MLPPVLIGPSGVFNSFARAIDEEKTVAAKAKEIILLKCTVKNYETELYKYVSQMALS